MHNLFDALPLSKLCKTLMSMNLIAEKMPRTCEAEFLAQVQLRMQDCIAQNSTQLLDTMAQEHFSVPGKLYRPRMVLGLGHIFQVPDEALVAWAACFELLHNATLIHDDLQDGDRFRRGRPAIWAQHGSAQAINLGDLLMLIAPQTIFSARLDAALSVELCQIFSRTAARIVNGQSSEFLLNQICNLEDLEERYVQCVSQKTSALFAGIAQGVALMAKAPDRTQQRLFDLFIKIGNIFQMQDDILDLYGEKKREAVGCDIKEGKVSVLVVNHLKHHPEDFSKLSQVLKKDREQTSQEDVEHIRDLFLHKRTLQRTMQGLNQMAEQALQESEVQLPTALREYVASILQLIFTPIQHLQDSKGL